jgi:hypothetical protein
VLVVRFVSNPTPLTWKKSTADVGSAPAVRRNTDVRRSSPFMAFPLDSMVPLAWHQLRLGWQNGKVDRSRAVKEASEVARAATMIEEQQ